LIEHGPRDPYGLALGAAIERALAAADLSSWERAQDQVAGDGTLREHVHAYRNPVMVGTPARCFSLERIVAVGVSQVRSGAHTDIILLDLEAEGYYFLGARVWPTSTLRFIAFDEVFGRFDEHVPASPVTLQEEREYGRFLIACKLKRRCDRRPYFRPRGTSTNSYDNIPTLALVEIQDRIRALLSWSDSPDLAAPCRARNASASPRNGIMHYFGTDVAQHALEAARAVLLDGGSPIDVLAAINRSGAVKSDPVQPSRGFSLWVGTPCHKGILESTLGTSNLRRLVTGNSALCQPDADLCLARPCPAHDMRHSGLA